MATTRLSSTDAKHYSLRLKMKTDLLGIELNDCILALGEDNDTKPGGERHTIVAFAQRKAREGATYGDVINCEISVPGGGTHKITTRDLAGFVCANRFCNLLNPITNQIINP